MSREAGTCRRHGTRRPSLWGEMRPVKLTTARDSFSIAAWTVICGKQGRKEKQRESRK